MRSLSPPGGTVDFVTTVEPRSQVAPSVLATLDAIEDACPHHTAEYYEGAFHVSPPASGAHNHAIAELIIALHAAGLPEGFSLTTDTRIHFAEQVFCPDVAVVRESAAKAVVGSAGMESDEVLLVIEVLSPSSDHKHSNVIKTACRESAIDYWIVTPSTEVGQRWQAIDYHDLGSGAIAHLDDHAAE